MRAYAQFLMPLPLSPPCPWRRSVAGRASLQTLFQRGLIGTLTLCAQRFLVEIEPPAGASPVAFSIGRGYGHPALALPPEPPVFRP